ncbi:MAG: hypothetical protein K2M82_06535 [Lachnospiraceae bacterium]|nr:hypothetical protein [Lachnospiraceae bacterium]
MSFVKKDGNEVDQSIWEHLDSLKVNDMYGDPLNRTISEVIMDREKEYYFVLCGVTNPNFDNVKIYFYSLCIHNDVIRFEVKKTTKGKAVDNSLEFHWNIVKAEFPKGWSFDKLSLQEFQSIVLEAFTTESYTNVFTPSRTKEITVDFSFDIKEGEQLTHNKK